MARTEVGRVKGRRGVEEWRSGGGDGGGEGETMAAWRIRASWVAMKTVAMPKRACICRMRSRYGCTVSVVGSGGRCEMLRLG